MAGRVLGIATAALVALLVGLWLMIRRDEAAVLTPHDVPSATAEVTQPPATGARTGSAAAIPLVRPAPPPVTQLAPDPGLPTEPPPPPVEDAARKRPTFKKALGEQVLATESLIAECSQQAMNAGIKLTGETAVSFTMAQHADGKIVLESTGVEYDSINNSPMIECIRDAAKQINLETLPDGAEAIIGYRKVRLKDGAVVENRMSEYSVVRGIAP